MENGVKAMSTFRSPKWNAPRSGGSPGLIGGPNPIRGSQGNRDPRGHVDFHLALHATGGCAGRPLNTGLSRNTEFDVWA